MRYTLAQLRKMRFPHSEVCTYDLTEELNGFEDIVSSGQASVKEVINYIGADSYEVHFDIEIDLEVECAITLEILPCKLRTKAVEFYTFDKETYDNGDFIYIEGQTLETKDEVLTQILIDKPVRTIKEGAEYIEEEDEEEDSEFDSSINPAFAALKDLLKK